MSKKEKFKIAAGAAITAVSIFFMVKVLSGIHPGELFRSNIKWRFVALSIAVYIAANYVRGLSYTRGIDRSIGRLNAFQIVGIGHALNMVLPFNAGEGLRAVFFPDDFSAIKRAKLLIIPATADVASILLISLLAVPFAGFRDPGLLRALWILFFIFIFTVPGGLIVAAVFFMPKLRSYAGEYINTGTVKMLFWVILSWVMLLISTWLGIMAFGFHLGESVRLALAVYSTTNILNFIPAAPGALGIFEYGAVLALTGLGTEQSKAILMALLLHLIQYASLLPLAGVLYITALRGKYGDTLRRLRHRRKEDTVKSEKTEDIKI